MANLTQTFAKRVKPPKSGYHIHYDGGLRGFGLRVTSNGAKSFVLNYWVHGRERRYTIGQIGAWTAETARAEAQRLRSLVDKREDPFVIQEAQTQQAIEEEARQRTMKELSGSYLSEHAEVHKRPRSVAEDRAMLDSIILPRLGRMRVFSIGRRDIAELHASLKGTPYRANRVLALLRKMFSFAISDNSGVWGIASNPAAGIPKFHEEKRDRWLSEDELQRLASAMQKYPDRCAAKADMSEKQRKFLRIEAQRAMNAIRLIMLTGCRKSEALSAKWTDFDLGRDVWTKPSHHTKQNRTEHVPLNVQALALLDGVSHNGEYLFPGRNGGHLQDLKHPWAQVCDAANLEGSASTICGIRSRRIWFPAACPCRL